ncbi:sporulation protein YqfD [Bacillus thermotolerans]|uniref:sporulation protein YqfD n=1 Tax=Bacillus thermotolerans TaxID=1221996 RepID=UPI00058365DF|nr:sporulation protein YqfD [Bacillus thermotolerans]KKB36428.1 Stage IV sporulation protein [Bacillus thermotolerans]
MNNQWLAFFQGVIVVYIQGQGAERFINQLIRSRIPVWQVTRHDERTVSFSCSLTHIHKIRRAARDFEGEVRFSKGDGFPFLWKRLLKNAGFVIGALLFLFVILLLSNIVWRIDINGATPKMEHEIRKELANIGVEEGEFILKMDDPETVQKKLLSRVKGLTWIGVEMKGSTFHFRVVEKNEPEEKKQAGSRHLVAAKDAVVTKLFVEKGQAVVKRNQFVRKGQLLVSGFIGSEGNLREVGAEGEVLGETWYRTSVEMPAETHFHLLTGQQVNKHFLELGEFSLPIWGFKSHSFAHYKKEEQEHSISFLGFSLPIKYNKHTYYESEQSLRSYTRQEAEKRALEAAREDLKAKLSEKAAIQGEKILQREFRNGKVKLSVHFQVLENIAVGKPITQGDRENARKKHNEHSTREPE